MKQVDDLKLVVVFNMIFAHLLTSQGGHVTCSPCHMSSLARTNLYNIMSSLLARSLSFIELTTLEVKVKRNAMATAEIFIFRCFCSFNFGSVVFYDRF